MRRTLRLAGPVLCLAILTTVGLAAQDTGGDTAAAAEERTTAEGVYSEEQASRGEDVMWNVCAECHVDEDFGAAFLKSWEGATVLALLEEIKATMPEDNPGGLPDQQYIDAISYVFRLNGLPAGEAELTLADLETIKIAVEP